jgi:hypothetical protein
MYVCSDGLHYFNGHGSCDALCKRGKHQHDSKERKSHVLRCTAIREAMVGVCVRNSGQQGGRQEKKTRTLVVDGIPKSEDSQHGDDDGRRRSVLAVEVARLDASPCRLGRRALGKLGVERDEGAEVGALPRRLQK